MNAHKTAMTRKTPSAPMRKLFKSGHITGRTLDYGSGKGHDAHTFGMEAFDPHYSPVMPGGLFNTITSTFVLNVIESSKERVKVLRDIQSRLADGGIAYITVRTDKRELVGTTNKGMWQGLIKLNLPVVQSGCGYTTYALNDWESIDESIQSAQTFERNFI